MTSEADRRCTCDANGSSGRHHDSQCAYSLWLRWVGGMAGGRQPKREATR